MFESTVVVARVYTDETGISYEMPVLLTPQGPVHVLLDYLLEHWDTRSPSWMLKVTSSVRLFLDYLDAHSSYPNEQAIFQTFRQRLITGTIAPESGEDPSGLWWSAKGPHKSTRVIRHLTDFFNWWAARNPGKGNPANTWAGSQHDLRLAESAYKYRRNKAFLGHTWSAFEESARSPGNKGASGKVHAPPRVEKETALAFPEDRILDLILKGFKVGNRYNYRDMLITLLLNGAGFRESEPFHLYLWDVQEDPLHKGQALVLIHHPAWGDAPPDPSWTDINGRPRQGRRVEYLAERYGLVPRYWKLSTSAAGWKGGMHESKYGGYYKQAYWFVPEFGKLFWTIWNLYAEQVLSVDASLRAHPYAFMNLMREPIGGLHKMGKYEASHAAAVRRIGLEPSKGLGTTIHGHRHAYGQRLRKAGVPKEMIRRFLHHTDLDSQNVYTEADRNECVKHLRLAVDRLSELSSDMRREIVQVTEANVEGLSMQTVPKLIIP
ncbi:gamma-mobile-trio recombinase GmtY [Rhodoferax mekongensis]|uniref:Gamma-mobile-trio recombinase GmtY n=1 Tax=Rhodoferax mekongensis TaxID=3068341 RepID=A0ABZ0AV78_9BURK|nr:gamma-mobile-trio recombinase GmtY [Rhodoferax sp. TBRC 17307]WNO03170.1 gamma-mobile-trio recombinase GmtY [Rhodoferax sp. TBRC 17307]